MLKYVFSFFVLLSSLANATQFQFLQWRLQPHARTYIAVMDGAKDSSNEYLSDGNLGRSNIYLENSVHQNLKVPSIHAYNPKTCRFAAIELDPLLMALLPENLPIPQAQVTRLFISIEMLDTEALRFRPHRFVDRNAPTYAQNNNYNNAPQIQAGVFNLDGTQVPFTDIPGQGLVQAGISIHAGAPRPAQNLAGTQILSPNNMHIPAVAGEPSRAYYSIVAHNDGQSRAAVTLHWLIKDRDANEMLRALRNSPTIEQFSQMLNQTAFVGQPATIEVQKLLPQNRGAGMQQIHLPPVIAGVRHNGAGANNNDQLELALALSRQAHEEQQLQQVGVVNNDVFALDDDLVMALLLADSAALQNNDGNNNDNDAGD